MAQNKNMKTSSSNNSKINKVITLKTEKVRNQLFLEWSHPEELDIKPTEKLAKIAWTDKR